MQGGLYNSLIRALQQFGLANAFGDSDIALLVLNVVYPLVPDEIRAFCADKRAVLVVAQAGRSRRLRNAWRRFERPAKRPWPTKVARRWTGRCCSMGHRHDR